jgi:cell division protein FtsW
VGIKPAGEVEGLKRLGMKVPMTPTLTRPSSTSTGITLVAAALLAIGVIMVFSASASLTSPPITQNPLTNPSFRQALFAVVALVVLLLVGLIPYEWLRMRSGGAFQPAMWLMFLAIGLLVAVTLFGQSHKGATRWLSVGGLSFQPSEVAKLAVVVFFSAYCSKLGERMTRFWTGLLPALLILGAVVALVGREDFGTAVLLLVVGGCILLAGGARIWHVCLLSLPALAGLVYLIWSKPNRVGRITAFLDLDADPQGVAYQAIQSLITIASGGWMGRGLGQGIQKYDYLPEAHNDFIFSVICEELGIVGGAAVILLFVVLVWQGRRAMLNASSEFGRLLALGATSVIGFQAAMNVAVVTVSVPTKGIGLPLVSAGGTGVVFLSIVMGLLVNVARVRVPVPSAIVQPGAERSAPSPQPPVDEPSDPVLSPAGPSAAV